MSSSHLAHPAVRADSQASPISMFPSSTKQQSTLVPTPHVGLNIASPRSDTQEVAIHLSRSLPSIRSTSSLRKRQRSVSSMKGLMPLALSTSSSSLRSVSSSEAIGDRVDEYFPELLAQDLELSMQVFAAKKMTAGTPVSSLSFEDAGKPQASRIPLSSPYLAPSVRVQSLGAIEERRSVVSFLDQQDPKADDVTSDLDSTSSTTNTSEDMAPPSFRHRESVMTVATSLASTNWKASPKRSSPPPDEPCESSWIAGDSDGEEQDDVNERNTGSLSPRLRTPLESDLVAGVTDPKRIDVRGHWGYNETALHRKSYSVSGGSPISSPRIKASRTSFDMPERPSTTLGTRRQEAHEPGKHCRVSPPFTAPRPISPRPEQTRFQCTHEATDTADKTLNKSLKLDIPTESSAVWEDLPDSETETMLPTGMIVSAYAKPASPRPALRSVQSWLNSSLQPCPRSLQNDDLTRVVPLPPDAMETLRVSVACFPETMLLSSSLTIETIRTYSKKVRQPSLEIVRSPLVRSPSPESPLETSRRSLWRKVVPYKRTSPGPERRHNHSSGESSIDSSNSGSVDGPKPWEPLKNVFGCCSDYICDALYAHIVAYNYVSALVARNPPPTTQSGRTYRHTVGDSQQEDIPKKAASLLGLTSTGDGVTAGFSRRAKGLTTTLGTWHKEETIHGQATASANHENMQSDLLRCISRLVATAKLMAETGEEPLLDMDVEDSDRLFVRSLCEIVRMAEEAS